MTSVKILAKPNRQVALRDASLPAESRISARAVKRIFDRESGELVGWLYEWNTGTLVPRWKSEVHDDVFYD